MILFCSERRGRGRKGEKGMGEGRGRKGEKGTGEGEREEGRERDGGGERGEGVTPDEHIHFQLILSDATQCEALRQFQDTINMQHHKAALAE